MAKVIPAIIAKDFQDLTEKVKKIEPHVEWAQLDIMDGEFVDNLTWPYTNGGLAEIKRMKTDLNLEAHLMVQDPERVIDQWIVSGVKRIIFHYESTKKHQEIIEKINQSGLEAGIAINPETSVNVLNEFLPLRLVLVMTVNPGRGGQKFMAKTLDKIRFLREKYPEMEIEVDGGINPETAQEAVKAGANLLASGSAIFNSQNIAQTIKQMKL